MGKYCFRYSYALWLIIPALIILFWLIRKEFVKFVSKDEQLEFEKERKQLKNIMILRLQSLD